MARYKRKKSGHPLEFLLLVIFVIMTTIMFIYPPWNYYDFSHISKKIPLFFGFFAYLNHNIYTFLGVPGILLPILLAIVCFMLIRGYNERDIYRHTIVDLYILVSTSITFAFFDSLFLKSKYMLGGKLGMFVSGLIPQEIWRWPLLFVFLLITASIILKHFFNKNLFSILWNWLSELSLIFEEKRLAFSQRSNTMKSSDMRIPQKRLSHKDDPQVEFDEPPPPPKPIDNHSNTVKLVVEENIRKRSEAELSEPAIAIKPSEQVIIEAISSGRGKTSNTFKLDLKPKKLKGQYPTLKDMGPMPTLPPSEEEDFHQTAKQIENKLREFNHSVNVEPFGSGPFLSIFKVKPKKGVKIIDLINRQDDISLALGRGEIRFDNRGDMEGVLLCEVPSLNRNTVYYRDIIEKNSDEGLKDPSFIVGVDIVGNPVPVSFIDLPHLLVGGATGSGKSVFLNMLISHLSLKYTPEQLRIILMDAKQLELTPYDSLPHLACPVVTDAATAENVLESLTLEMDDRYSLLNDFGHRNLTEYWNACKTDDIQPELCFTIVVIDELADLLMTGSKYLTDLLIRLAQKSRAVGIHLVVATQRPSVDVVSGLIKANFTSRIAFKVATDIDSKVILDIPGAKSLLGNGDMLFCMAGAPPRRLHSGFLTTKEVANYTKWWDEHYPNR